jgi:hypothetical protein
LDFATQIDDEARDLVRASPPELVEAMKEAWHKRFLSERD